MKRTIITLSAGLILSMAQAQTGTIETVLRSIEQNNKELQADGQLAKANALEARTDNNLPDPTVNYSYQFGSPQELGKTGELTVSQGFDFPTLYGARNKVNKLKTETFDNQHGAFRRQLLLTAKELCLDLVLLNQERALLDHRLKNAGELSALYELRLKTGDANILETNKIRLELMTVQTEAATNESARKAKLQELVAMNGNQPLEFNEAMYRPGTDFSAPVRSIEELRHEVIASDLDLLALQNQSEAARKQITVSKSGWLPKLEVGYRRNTGEGELFNGFTVGGSLPLFENRGKVKVAKAQSIAAELQRENAYQKAEAGLVSLYGELEQLQASMKAYDNGLMDETLVLLKKALTARQISMIEYFTEVETIYQSKLAYMQLENRYQKLLAQVYKNRL